MCPLPRLSDQDDWVRAEQEVHSAFHTELGEKFEFRRVLSHGGMGKVVLARHRQLGELVAIKLLHSQFLGGDSIARFVREARAAAKIKSDHVVRVRDVGVLGGGTPFIVMEYLEGLDLAEWLAKNGRLPVDQAVDFILQALDAIAEAHALGIVHRDLKPGNLFATLARDGGYWVKVVDFGLAKRTAGSDSIDQSVTQPGTLVGSPSYMSPEQFLDAQDVDTCADVWAVGACLFELLTGTPSFQAPSMPQLYAAIAHGRIRRVRELLPEVPPDLDEIVARCLSRRRSERYADGAALRDALLAISPPKPISPAKSVNAWHARTLPSVAPSSGSSPQSVSLDPVSSSTDARDRLRRLGLVRAVPIGRLAFGFALVVLLAATLFRRSSPPVPRTAVEAPRSRQQQQERSPASSKLLGGGVQGPLEDTAPVPSARAAESAATRPEKRAIRVPKVNAPGLPSSSPTAMPAGPSATSPASIYDKYP